MPRRSSILVLAVLAIGCYEGDPNSPLPPGANESPLVTGVSPATAAPGDVVTIRGSNFGNDPSRVSVTFGSVHVGQVLFVAPTNIEVRIPVGASGNLRIVVVVGGLAAIGPNIVVT